MRGVGIIGSNGTPVRPLGERYEGVCTQRTALAPALIFPDYIRAHNIVRRGKPLFLLKTIVCLSSSGSFLSAFLGEGGASPPPPPPAHMALDRPGRLGSGMSLAVASGWAPCHTSTSLGICPKGMPCTQCEVLDVGKYSNPSFGPFSQVFGSVPGLFWLPKHLGCGIFELSTISP